MRNSHGILLHLLEKKIPLNWGPDGLTAHVVNNAMAIKYPGTLVPAIG